LEKYYPIILEKVRYLCPASRDQDDAIQFVSLHVLNLFPKRHKWDPEGLDNIVRSVINRKVIDHLKKYQNNIVTEGYGDEIIENKGLLSTVDDFIDDDDNRWAESLRKVKDYVYDNPSIFTQEEIDLFNIMNMLAKIGKPLNKRTLVRMLGYNYEDEDDRDKGKRVVQLFYSKIIDKFQSRNAI